MTFPIPLSPAVISEADVLTAVYAFVLAYALPAMDAANIVQGWQNRVSLPAGVNDFAVIAPITRIRRGTDIESFDASTAAADEDGTLSESEMIQTTFQIDLCSDINSGNAERRAQALETVARSYLGTRFFEDYGIACHYGSDVRRVPTLDDSNQYLERCLLTLTLAYWTTVSAEVPWFSAVNLIPKNVDVIYPPK